jgi:hypothetical protein
MESQRIRDKKRRSSKNRKIDGFNRVKGNAQDAALHPFFALSSICTPHGMFDIHDYLALAHRRMFSVMETSCFRKMGAWFETRKRMKP